MVKLKRHWGNSEQQNHCSTSIVPFPNSTSVDCSYRVNQCFLSTHLNLHISTISPVFHFFWSWCGKGGMSFLVICTSKANKISFMHINLVLVSRDWSCYGEELVECWMKAWMFFWYVFIGPLVKGSNRYQDARAGFCHDTSAVQHEKALFLPTMGHVLYICGCQSFEDKIKSLLEISGQTQLSAKPLVNKVGKESGMAKMKSFHFSRP